MPVNISSDSFIYFCVAALIVDLVVIFLIRYNPDNAGKPINDWYNQFGLSAVVSDVMIIVLGLLITQYLYTNFLQPTLGWNLFAFIALALAVQAIHDILFYFFVIRPIPKGHNSMIDVFKAYAEEGQYKVVLADSAMVFGSAIIAAALKAQPIHVTTFLGALAVYTTPYILTTTNKFTHT